MNVWFEDEEEEVLGFEVRARSGATKLSQRKAQSNSRQLTGQQKQSRQARYSRRPGPTRVSSAKCGRHKARGF